MEKLLIIIIIADIFDRNLLLQWNYLFEQNWRLCNEWIAHAVVPAGDNTNVIRSQSSQSKKIEFSYLTRSGHGITSIGPAPGIKPSTSRSAIKRSTDWANPAAELYWIVYS